MERSRLAQARTLAYRRQDQEEVKQLDERIAELDLTIESERKGRREESSVEDMLAKVNERNRRANAETLKNIAAREEKKRRERKLAMANGSATPRLLGSRYVFPYLLSLGSCLSELHLMKSFLFLPSL
jgi:RNA polymerase-associated protein RTF1